jgi:uncharacterized protein YhdP
MSLKLVKKLHKIWRRLLGYGLIGVVIIMVVSYLLTLFCNRYKHDLELKASELLHVPVSIATIRLGWHGYHPALSLRKVTLLSPLNHQAIVNIKKVQFGLQLCKSLWQRQVILQTLALSKVDLSLATNDQGKLELQNLPSTVAADSAANLWQVLAWITQLPNITLANLTITVLTDSDVTATILVNKLQLENFGQHYLSGSVELQQAKTTAVTFKVYWSGELRDYWHTNGHASLKLASDSYAELAKFIAQIYPPFTTKWQLAQGMGSGDLLLYWQQAHIQQANVVLQLHNLLFNDVTRQQSYFLPKLSGHFKWQDIAGQQLAVGENVVLGFNNHVWPLSNFIVKLARQATTEPTISAQQQQTPVPIYSNLQPRLLKLSYVNIPDILPILLATSLLKPQWQQLISKLQLKGAIHNLTVLWQKSGSDWQHIVSSGRASLLSWQPYQQWPGFNSASCGWHWNGREANINCGDTVVHAAHIFNHDLDFSTFNAKFTIEQQQAGWLLGMPSLTLSNQDISTQSQLQLFLPAEAAAKPPTINISSDFSVAHLEKLTKYLPESVVPAQVLTYLDHALLAGNLDAGHLTVAGPIPKFLDSVQANTAVTNQQSSSAMLKMQVSATLHDATVKYAPNWPVISQANGQVVLANDKANHQLKIDLITGRLFNLKLSKLQTKLLLPPHSQASNLLQVNGVLHGDLAQAIALLRQSPLAEAIDGKFNNYQPSGPFALTLGLSIPLNDPQQVKVNGSLVANDAVLGVPFFASKITNITGHMAFNDQQISDAQFIGQLWQQNTSLNLFTTIDSKNNKIINAAISGKINVADLPQFTQLNLGKVLSGSSNYKITGRFPQSSPALQQSTIHLTTDLRGLTINSPLPSYNKTANDKRNLELELTFAERRQYLLRLNYSDLLVANLKVAAQEGLTKIDITSKAVDGSVFLPYPFSTTKLLTIDLRKLYLPALPQQHSGQELVKPQDLPSLDLKVADLRYNNLKLGRLSLRTSHLLQGLAIDNCHLLADDYNFISKGQWYLLADGHHSHFSGILLSHDIKTLLSRFAITADAIVVTDGNVKFDFTWHNPPYLIALNEIFGGFNFYVDKGRVINLTKHDNQKMGFGRLISLFSLQTLPRRLSLDFSDLLEQGYSFDFIKGGVRLSNGNAYTNKKIILEGPVANISAHGRIGLLQQDYDLFLSVEPQLTSSLPVIAGALTLNPLVGAATWLVNKVVLNKQISKVVSYNYLITGSWRKPLWQALDNKNTKRTT